MDAVVDSIQVQESGRERFLREAQARFTERGFVAVTMQEIADAVGLTKAAVYYHFRDKESLFVEVFAAEMTRLAEGVRDEVGRGGPFRDQLLRVTRFLLDRGNLDLARLIGDFDRYVTPERRREIRASVLRPSAVLAPTFARARDAGEIRPVNLDLAIALYLAMVHGQARYVVMRQQDCGDTAELAETIVDMTLHGISA